MLLTNIYPNSKNVSITTKDNQQLSATMKVYYAELITYLFEDNTLILTVRYNVFKKDKTSFEITRKIYLRFPNNPSSIGYNSAYLFISQFYPSLSSLEDIDVIMPKLLGKAVKVVDVYFSDLKKSIIASNIYNPVYPDYFIFHEIESQLEYLHKRLANKQRNNSTQTNTVKTQSTETETTLPEEDDDFPF